MKEFKNSPLQKITTSWSASPNFYIKRDDLLHKDVSGNKGRKLLHYIKKYKDEGYKGILTYGGAYSNHLVAMAYLGNELSIPTIAIVRGDELNSESNVSLKYCASKKMELIFTSRILYRAQSQQNKWPNDILKEIDQYLIIPEGGRGPLGQKGCKTIALEVEKDLNTDKTINYFISAGTGTTALGLVKGLRKQDKLFVVSALKGNFLEKDLKSKIDKNILHQVTFLNDFHFGGYAKYNDELIDFIHQFYTETSIPLDPIYESKMLYGLKSLTINGIFEPDDIIVAIHAGGLQGIKGFNEKNKNIISLGINK